MSIIQSHLNNRKMDYVISTKLNRDTLSEKRRNLWILQKDLSSLNLRILQQRTRRDDS